MPCREVGLYISGEQSIRVRNIKSLPLSYISPYRGLRLPPLPLGVLRLTIPTMTCFVSHLKLQLSPSLYQLYRQGTLCIGFAVELNRLDVLTLCR